ncbi:arylamine N-acetyltransferase family protein [Kluyvera genomosp. 1]|uniref:arylamine N-acetyltransferase family protein n=1 Tax=Kluyvera genomosp. 1 TaxID=2774053 RepID=UPI000A53C0CC|nr:arylamine N-acetyltransferase [Kluyvera genomosp. 1]
MNTQDIQMAISLALAEQVLEKLGFGHLPALTEQGLTQLYQAWCRRVPFDNIRKRIQVAQGGSAVLPGFTPDDFLSHWLRFGTGGTCWAGHGALYALLKASGFAVQFGLSTMRSPRPVSADSPGHGTLFVRLEETLFLVDATMLHGQPLPLQAWHSPHPIWGTRVHRDEGVWCINWKPLGRSRIDCHLLNLNAAGHEFPQRHEQSRHNSRFDGALHIRLAGRESITGIVKGEKVVREASGKESFSPLSHHQQKMMLLERFGIAPEIVAQLPPDDLNNQGDTVIEPRLSVE